MADENLFDDVKSEGGEAKVDESTEYSPDTLSTRPAGESYERPNLGGQTLEIKDAKIFGAQKEDPIITGTSGKAKYKKCKFMVYYNTPNDDREGLSGVIQFIKTDGTLAPPSIYYEGQNQAAMLYKKVAAKLNKNAEDLSMSEFLKFLKGKPKAEIHQESFTWQGKTTIKNMIKAFV